MSENKQFSFEQIVSARVPECPVISADGRYVAYVNGEASKAGEHPVSDIWLIDTRDRSQHRLTTGESRDAEPAWSPDGSHLAFASDRAERGTSQIYVTTRAGCHPVQVTFEDGGAYAPLWSPDGSMIACLVRQSESPAERERREEKGDQWVVDDTPRRSQIWVIDIGQCLDDVLAGKVRLAIRQVSPCDVHVGSMMHSLYDWAPGSDAFAAIISESPKVDHLWFAEVASISLDGDVRRLGAYSGLFTPPSYSPDGSSIAFIGAGDESPMSIGVPYVVRVADGTASPLPLRSRGSATGITWVPGTDRVVVTLVESLSSQLYEVSVAEGQDQPLVHTGHIPGTVNSLPSINNDGTTIAFVRSDSASPPDVWLGQRGGSAERVTDLNPWVRDCPVGDVREINWTSTDGSEVNGLLYLPVGYREGQAYPLLAHIHGGPMGAWTHRFYCSWHDWAVPMTQRGYAVFMPNPRGSSGRGPGYLAANRADLGGLEWEDIETGIDEVIRMGIADPDQLVFGGWSYGGFFTNWAITHSDRFKAAVSGASISNWVSFNGTTDIRRIFDAYFANPLHESADGQWERSPVRYFNQVTTPTLFVHGDADIRVPISQSYEMYYGVKDRGVETQMVVYPREAHMIAERKHQLDMLERVTEWFDRHLGR